MDFKNSTSSIINQKDQTQSSIRIYIRLLKSFVKILKSTRNETNYIQIAEDFHEIVQLIHKLKSANECEFIKDILYIIEMFIEMTIFQYISIFFLYLRHSQFDLNHDKPFLFSNNFQISSPFLKISQKELVFFEEKIKNPQKEDLFQSKVREFSNEMRVKLEQSQELNDYYTFIIKSISLSTNDNHHLGLLFFHDIAFIDYPSYLNIFNMEMNSILNNDYSLSESIIYFTFIMSASISKSHHVLKLMHLHYLASDGDENWLIEGIKSAPVKIQIISSFLNKLANACWTISKDEINCLVYSQYWNIKEVTHIVILFLFGQRICSIVESIGVSNKIYDSKSYSYIDIVSNQCLKKEEANNKDLKLKSIISQLNQFNNLNDDDLKGKSTKNFELEEESPDKSKDIYGIHKSIQKEKDNQNQRSSFKVKTPEMDIFQIYIENNNRKYIDFDQRVFDYESYIDFNWSDQGYIILKEIFSSIADCINTETELASEMTNNYLGDNFKNVNTKHIRQAIWCYIEKIYGYERESYNYTYVNKLLDKESKTFIKYSTCFPEYISLDLINQIPFTISEMIHIIILSNASKFRTQLTFYISKLYEVMNNDS